MTATLPRRAVLSGLLMTAAAALIPARTLAEDRVVEIGWQDLVPGASDALRKRLEDLRVVEHGDLATDFVQPPASTGVTTAYDGKRVRLPGFVVPLDFDGTRVTRFILVPYVGACIHVPPPPANQLVLVTAPRPFGIGGLFDPVEVTGVMRAGAESTGLAEIGYAIAADSIRPYRF